MCMALALGHAYEGNDRLIVFLRDLCYSHRNLSFQALRIQRTLTGKYIVTFFYLLFHIHRLDQILSAADMLCITDAVQRTSDSSGRSCSRHVRYSSSGCLIYFGSVIFHSCFQFIHHFFCCTLLCPKHTGSSLISQQWTFHIIQDDHFYVFHPFFRNRKVHVFYLNQSPSAPFYFLPVPICNPGSQCQEHSTASVIGSRSAQSKNQLPAAHGKRMADQFSHTIGRGPHRIFLIRSNQHNAAGFSHLNHSLLLFFVPQKFRVDFSSHRILDDASNGFSCPAHTQALCCSFPAVRHRKYFTDRLGYYFMNRFLHYFRSFSGGHTSFVRIRGYQKFHFSRLLTSTYLILLEDSLSKNITIPFFTWQDTFVPCLISI